MAVTKKIKSHWIGESYKRINTPQFLINQKILNKVDFTSVSSVLDIGCGSGETTNFFFVLSPNRYIIVQIR